MIKYQGIITKGHGVASGQSLTDQKGTIERQKPFFKAQGLNLSHCYNGTINVDLKPFTVAKINPDVYFKDVDWNKNIAPENFSFVHCILWFNQQSYAGYIYYPDPATKPGHFQHRSVIEVIAPEIKHIAYGLPIEIEVSAHSISVISVN